MTEASPEASAFVRLLERIDRAGQTIRVAHAKGGRFDHHLTVWEDLDQAVDALTADQRNTWFEINESSFTGDTGRSAGRHITRLNTLYVDVDYKDGGMGSLLNAQQLIDDLSAALGVPPAAVVHTGNGLQPYWPISDGLVAEHGFEAILTLLARFREFVGMFASALGGKVDNLFDLPRIFRVPGSYNWKDADDPKPVTADFPDGWEPFTVAELNEIFDDYQIAATPREIADEIQSVVTEWEWAEHDCHFVDTFRQEVLTQPVTARHPWMLARVAQLHGMMRYGCLTEASFLELRRLIDIRHGELCRSQAPYREPSQSEYVSALRWGLEQAQRWTLTKLTDEMRSHAHTDFLDQFAPIASPVPSILQAPEPPADAAPVIGLFSRLPVAPPVQREPGYTAGALALAPSPQTQMRLTRAARTDSGNAELYAQHVAGRFLFVGGIGWYAWDGARFREDTVGEHREALKDLFTQRLASTNDVEEEKWLLQSLNNARMAATLKWAETVPAVRASAAEMDTRPLELVTPGGIVDLAGRTIRPAQPLTDRNTKITAVAPDWSGPPERFLGVLEWAFAQNPEMIGYLQRLFGMALIGENRGQIFPVFQGPGANGKSLIFEIVLGVAGEYGMKMSQKFLIQTKSDQHPEEIAALRGVRIALASEVPKNAKFNEELVKALTGDSTVRARKLFENSAEARNTTTLMAAMNHLPTVTDGGTSWWRRQRIIPMPRIWPEDQRDDTLGQQIIAAEGGKILAWMIDGTAAYLADGEQRPELVRAATARYRSEEDALARYIEMKLIWDADTITTRQAIYSDYQMWANMNRVFPVLSEPKFAREFTDAHPSVIIDGDETYYRGVGIARLVPQENYDPLAAVLSV